MIKKKTKLQMQEIRMIAKHMKDQKVDGMIPVVLLTTIMNRSRQLLRENDKENAKKIPRQNVIQANNLRSHELLILVGKMLDNLKKELRNRRLTKPKKRKVGKK